MLGKIFGVLVAASFFFGVISGSMDAVGKAVSQGSLEAVILVGKLAGMLCLWNGASRVLESAGITKLLLKAVRPVLSRLYPNAARRNNGLAECASCACANFLGLGSAALPLGLAAVKKLKENSPLSGDVADDEMILFSVLATVPFQLLPTTLAVMREAAGSDAPYEILLPVWLCSVLTIAFAVVLCRVIAAFGKKSGKKQRWKE